MIPDPIESAEVFSFPGPSQEEPEVARCREIREQLDVVLARIDAIEPNRTES